MQIRSVSTKYLQLETFFYSKISRTPPTELRNTEMGI